MGALFVLWGFTDPGRFAFLIILGVCFLVFGVFSFIQSRRLDRKRQETNDLET
jgi:preprotein translocase subunit YajC